jgi:hypothetical protein
MCGRSGQGWSRGGDLPDAAAQLGARQWQSVRVRRYWAAMSQENVEVVHATYEQIPGLAAKEAEA